MTKKLPSRIELSQMDCYAGKFKAEAIAHEADVFDEPGVYAQFIEGCGHHVFTMTPDEADQFADMIKAAADKSRKSFKKR